MDIQLQKYSWYNRVVKILKIYKQKINSILITGAGGFIGFHLSLKLLNKIKMLLELIIYSYYDPKIKKQRIQILKNLKSLNF